MNEFVGNEQISQFYTNIELKFVIKCLIKMRNGFKKKILQLRVA